MHRVGREGDDGLPSLTPRALRLDSLASVHLRALAARAVATRAGFAVRRLLFRGSGRYWERRYATGGGSGAGSSGAAARWKADVVNAWVREYGVESVVDYGCGDGNQLALAEYPRYLGLDRSPTAIRTCIARFRDDRTKSFLHYDPEVLSDPARWLCADLALSMEVLFHLVEDDVFEDYLRRLFGSAQRFVAICSIDTSGGEGSPHERYRRFTEWIRANSPQWQLLRRVDPPRAVDLMSSLYLYARRPEAAE